MHTVHFDDYECMRVIFYGSYDDQGEVQIRSDSWYIEYNRRRRRRKENDAMIRDVAVHDDDDDDGVVKLLKKKTQEAQEYVKVNLDG